MGGYAANIGDFALHMGDYIFDYVKDRQPKEYYDNWMVDMEFIQYQPGWLKKKHPWSVEERNKKVWDILIPLSKLGNIKKLKKYYRFESDFDLKKLMWEEIVGRGCIVEGYVAVSDHYTDKGGGVIFKYYYLTSEIGEEPIKLQSPTEGVDILHHVRNYDEHIWMIKHALDFYTEIRK